ncbi:hypothetical protein [Nocardiopsis ansamitocini]|uniref:Uncharacterized protein n=1 Tax=Nocardiopsis ansamitocini TaxID=1670832 RepID=A0A9W6UHG0_9ACTN|nr:hypothetical protein [Nocardiopsis ansamitocini]GLU46697.1 hypothetical protein Nans01_10480 [Nocardiopsis ansamitocini]
MTLFTAPVTPGRTAFAMVATSLAFTVPGCTALDPLTFLVREQGPEYAIDPADPFGDSPAADYPLAAEAISRGPVDAVLHGVEQSRVDAALTATEELLTAVYLTPEAVFDGDNSAFQEILEPELLSWFEDGLDAEGENSTRAVVLNLAPGSAELIGTQVRALGETTVRKSDSRVDDLIEVAVRYNFVYPIAKPDESASTRLVIGAEGTFVFSVDPVAEPDVRLRTFSLANSATPVHCDLDDDSYLVPLFPTDLKTDGPGRGGAVVDPYDLGSEFPQGECSVAYPT